MDDARHLQVFKLEGRCNKMDFIRGFPGVASRFGIEGIVYEGRQGLKTVRREQSGIGSINWRWKSFGSMFQGGLIRW